MGSDNLNTRESQKAPMCSFAQPFVLCIFLGNTSLSNNTVVFLILLNPTKQEPALPL